MTYLNLMYIRVRNMVQVHKYTTDMIHFKQPSSLCMKMNTWKHITESMNNIFLKSSLPLTQQQHFYPHNSIVNTQCCIVTKQKYFVTVLKQFFFLYICTLLYYLYFCLLCYILQRKLILLLRYISPETFVTRYKIKSSLEKKIIMRVTRPMSGTVVEHRLQAGLANQWSQRTLMRY